MTRLVTEIQADIDTLEAAKLKVLQGTSIKSLTVGSNDMQRRYAYSEINLPMLKLELSRLYAELAAANGESAATFGTVRSHHININTGRY